MITLFDIFFFFKQKTAYEMRISDWSSDVCSSDLGGGRRLLRMERRSGERGGEQHIFPGRHVGVPYPVDQAAFLSSFAFAFNHFDIWSATSVPSRMPQTTRLAPRTISPAAKKIGRAHV